MSMLIGILVVAACIMVILIVARLLSIPFRLVRKVIWNSMIGFVILSLFNLFGEALFHFSLDITLLSTVIAGFFGIPGVIILILVALIF